ncbi:MAG: hypothetical protein EXR72_02460 [Myxococcales bacterium]|nr:hypothetical protein [Myxococcales bacterium]
MRSSTLLPALLFALAPVAHAGLPPEATAPAAPPLTVTLVQKTKLRLVRFVPSKAVALDGILEATIANPSAQPVRVRDLEVHGVLFSNRKGGATRVITHSCKCVKDAAEPAKASVEIEAGASRKVLIDEWGCGGGMWPAPPPGSWSVVYRVLAAPAAVAAPNHDSPSKITDACRRDFDSPAFWEDAVSSAPLEITLKKAVPVKPR